MERLVQAARYTAITLALIGAFSAFAGGYGMIVSNGLGMPISYLNGTLFDSWILPGFILFGIVGGTQIIAVFLLIRNSEWQHFGLAVAGFGMIVWIFCEMYITGITHWLQILYFSLGIMELTIVAVLLGVLPGTVERRSDV